MTSLPNPQTAQAMALPPALAGLPTELILQIATLLPSEADRQSLRNSGRLFRTLIPPAPLHPPQGPRMRSKGWLRPDQQQDFLARVLRDQPEEARRRKMACRICCVIVDREQE